MLKKLLEFKSEIDFSQFIKQDNGYCHYGYANMFWLEFVMNLMGYSSYSQKINRLKEFKDRGQLEVFYKNIGIEFKKSKHGYPTLATWSEYKVAIIVDSPYLKHFHSLFEQYKPEFEALVHLAIDGKDIRHTQDEIKRKANVKSINVVSSRGLEYSEFTHNENNWIKRFFLDLTEELKKN
jgi:hypothetical protein